MSSVICPHCGREIHIRFFTPKKLTCPTCDVVFTAEYNDENGNSHPGGIEGFKVTHPNLTKAADITFKVGVGVLFFIGFKNLLEDKINELAMPPEASSESEHTVLSCEESSETSNYFSKSDEPLSYGTKDVPVEGCKVKLPPNKHPSQQKRETAAANGYDDLGENETWRVPTSRTIKVTAQDT